MIQSLLRVVPLLVFCVSTAVVQAQNESADEPIFEKKPYYRTLAERWELDSATRRVRS